MRALEPLDQRLRRCETNESSGHKAFTRAVVWWACLDIPGRGSVDGEHRNLRVPQCLYDFGKRLADLSAEGEAENCVDNLVGLLYRRDKVIGEGNV
jgi:hypothetical protein